VLHSAMSKLLSFRGDRGRSRTPRRVAAITVAAGAVVLAACGSSGTSSSSSASAPPAQAASTGSSSALVVKTADSPLGVILVDANGLTLYTLTSAGRPIPCNTSCTAVWPPLLVPAGTSTPTGSPAVGGTVGKSASGKVVTYKGFPLFHFSGDKAPGQTGGNGVNSFGGTWTVVKAGSTPGM